VRAHNVGHLNQADEVESNLMIVRHSLSGPAGLEPRYADLVLEANRIVRLVIADFH